MVLDSIYPFQLNFSGEEAWPIVSCLSVDWVVDRLIPIILGVGKKDSY